MRNRSAGLLALALVSICVFGCVHPPLPPRVEKIAVSRDSIAVPHDFLVHGDLKIVIDNSEPPLWGRFQLMTPRGEIRVSSLNCLAGFVEIRNEKEALQYVRLFYSPSNWQYSPHSGYEIATPDVIRA